MYFCGHFATFLGSLIPFRVYFLLFFGPPFGPPLLPPIHLLVIFGSPAGRPSRYYLIPVLMCISKYINQWINAI